MNELKNKTGLYQIVSAVSGKKYIGSSNCLYRRCGEHFGKLKGNNHFNPHLQNAWNKYGEEAFQFEVLEEVEEDQLLKREQEYFDSYRLTGDWDKLYNIAEQVFMVRGYWEGRKRGEGFKRKMSKIMSGKTLSKKTKEKISKANKGKVVTKKTKEKISKANKGNIVSEKQKVRLREINLGKNLSNKVREKIGLSIGELKPREVVTIRGRYYLEDISYERLSKNYPVGGRAIAGVINGESYKNCGGPIKGVHYEKICTGKKRQVVEIRGRYYLEGGLYQSDISEDYGIPRPTVSSIVRGGSWNDIGGPIKGVHYE